jgi:multidrug resistance efflux pump
MEKLRKEIRKILFENRDLFLELEIDDTTQKNLENMRVSIERIENNIERAKKELEVARTNKSNTQKTMSSIKDIDKDVEKAKKQLAYKEFNKYGQIEKDKVNLIKDLETQKSETEKKMAELDRISKEQKLDIDNEIPTNNIEKI